MTKKILLLFLLLSVSVQAQTYIMQNGSFNTCSGTFYDSGDATGNYSANEDYQLTFCPATPGTYIQLTFTAFDIEIANNLRDYMTIYNGTGTSGDIIANYFDSSPTDCSGVVTSSDPSGCITVVFSSNNNNQRSGWEATISCSATQGNLNAPTNSVCSGANPFCADSGLEYPNLSDCDNVPDAPQEVTDNTCLNTAPNPAWYYLSIGISGVIDLEIKQSTGPNNTGNGLDVDFAIWGPFPDPISACNDFTLGDCNGDHNCTGNVVDCSYDPAPIENATIPNALVGEVYMVLITNYDGDAGFITMEQTNAGQTGAGSTDCSIVCPTFVGINPTCGGSNGMIKVAGLGAFQTHQITYLDDGAPVTISLTGNANGQATISGLNAGSYTNILTDIVGCTNPSTVTLTSSVPNITAVNATSPICSGGQAVFTITGTASATVTYNINGGASQTVTLNASGIGSVTVNAVTAAVTLNTVSISLGATCSVNVVLTKSVLLKPASIVTLATASATENQVICENSSIATIQYTIGGSATGASVSGLPNGVTGTFASGVLTISGTPTQTGSFNYTVTSSGGCTPHAVMNGTITINVPASATISYPLSPYCNSLTTPQPVTITGTTGGTFTCSPSGLTINPNTGAITPSSSNTINYTVIYTIPASGGCPAQVVTTQVRISAVPTASISYATPFCNSITTAQAVTRTGTAGGTYSATPAGLTIDPNTGAIRPNTSLSNSYTVTYTMPAAAGCAAQTTTANVVITTLPAATISYPSTPYCKSLTGAQGVVRTGTGGGTYSATPAGLTIDANTGAIIPSTSLAGNYNVTYTMAAVGGCPMQTATTTLTITAIPTATISYATPFCNSITTAQAVTRTGTAGGTYSATPAGLTIDPNTGAIRPNTSLSNSYTVTYTMSAAAGCAAQTTTANVVITTLPAATISYPSTPYCKSLTTAQAITRTGTAGGTYSATPAGLTIDANTGAIIPSTSLAGNYNVTYTMAATGGCPLQTATTPVTITAIPSATISYATPFCNSLTTAQAVTRTGTAGGTYSATPSGLTIDPNTGAIRPNTSLSNSYTVTYTMSAAAGCAAQTTTANVVITTLPAATISYPSTPYCKSLTGAQGVVRTGTGGGTYSATPAGLTIDANTGAIIPSTSLAGNYNVTYTMAAVGGCPMQTATTTLTITAIPTATISYATPFCNSLTTAQAVTRTGTAGGTYSATPSGLTIDPNTGAIRPNTSLSNSYTVTYTMPAAAGCAAQTTTANVVITTLPAATISYPSTPYCKSLTGAQGVVRTGTGGGTYSATPAGLTIDANTGAIIPSTSLAGNYNVTYTMAAVGGCPMQTATTTLTITAIPSATISYPSNAYCNSEAVILNVTRVGTQGGTYSSVPAGLSIHPNTGAIVPNASAAGSYQVVYTMPAAAGCAEQTTSTSIIIKALPVVTASSQNVTICSGDTFSVSFTSSLPNTTYSWVRLADQVNGSNVGSGSVLSETLTTVNSSPGNVYYTVTPNSDGCDGLPIVVTVRVNPLPEPQPVDGVICINNITNSVTKPYTINTYLNDSIYDFVWSFNAAVITSATSSTYQATQAGTYEVVATNSFTGCVSLPVQVNVSAINGAQSMSTYGYDAFTENPMVGVNVNVSGNYMYQLDHGPIQYSNVFYNVPPGIHTVYVIDEDGCTQLSEEILVISYPKFFTPNNDGYNDTWNIVDLADQKQSIIYIFDRYGKLIKQISPSGKGWDGTYNGYELPSTDYWFSVEYTEKNVSKIFKAHFSLKR
ncbi:T9SS type B sorting domain-containing protein [Flavobacterium sp. CYK-55]|uniref:T9SS type B sorting domain-containing protein n=1 Tax=Flavobacterium sp. CYK-55 TaxID=2835529 RepID=UPI001BCBCAD3|nr:T9SS type B sorting domain-containing protein [Flavobacterium sp. CYK-55]MBS7786644.1 T9SS type B sorting domain-containing protein [Flavobacterium sp. CYK-55]